MRARLSTGRQSKVQSPKSKVFSALCFLCFLLFHFSASAQTNFAAYWNFTQIFDHSPTKRHEAAITPLFSFTSNATNLFVGAQTNQVFTDTNNLLVVSNLLPGFAYRLTYKPVADPFYGSKPISLTNIFPSSLTNGAYINGADPAYLAASTNSSDTSVAANNLFLQRRNDSGSNITLVGTVNFKPGTGAPGYVWTQTNATTGAGFWAASQGGGGGGSSGDVVGPSSSTVGDLAEFDQTTGKHIGGSGLLVSQLIGWAQWATNVFGSAAFLGTNTFDLAGTGAARATAATNGLGIAGGLSAFRATNTFDVAGAATAATNGYPWGSLYDTAGAAIAATNGIGIASGLSAFRPTNTFDVAGAATAATNGYPWGTLYDAAGAALAATNGLGIASGLSAVVSTNRFAAAATTLTIAGTANQITSSAGAQDLSGNRVWTLSFPSTLILPGTLNVTGDQTNQGNFSVLKTQTNYGGIVQKAGVTNETITAGSMVKVDANQKFSAATAGTDYLAPNGNGATLTNTITHTHQGTTTNLTAAFNGTLQSFTCTNGPSIGQHYFFHYAGANGSVSYRFSGSSYNNLHFDYQPKWLAGSNSVITNGVLSITSYGGTNAAQIEAAIAENQ